MDPRLQIKILRDQLVDLYVNAVYTHKTHEKASERVEKLYRITKWSQIFLTAISATSIFTVLFKSSVLAIVLSAITSCASLAINLLSHEFDLVETQQKYNEIASKYLSIRDAFFSLIVDINAGLVQTNEIREKRDALQERINFITSKNPNVKTTNADYKRASLAINKCGEAETDFANLKCEIDS
jgi:hypothetical protein